MTLPSDPGTTRTRRDFVTISTSAVGAAWLMRLGPVIVAAQGCASEALREGIPFSTFTDREGTDFDAFAARIIPTDDTPGAREAGAVYFADRSLGGWAAELLPIVRAGLAAVNERVASGFDGVAAFADLDESQQDEIIGALEEDEPAFFFFAHTLVTLSLATNPSYGGNRDRVGWQLMGFEDGFVYQPPFGYYDQDEHA